jgi:MCP family monocarboxylic acid transporter-like MFS transporter 10
MAGSLNFLGGPAASYLCNRYGCRAVAFIGAILAILGLFLTSFVQETSKMYVTYGLLWGVGSSFSFIPSIVVLGQYFHRRFPLANSIASSGSGIGSLLAAPLINYLLSTVKWQNSMRILACIAMLLLLSAFLYRPVNVHAGRRINNMESVATTTTSIWKCKPYLVLIVAVAMFQLCYTVPYVHLVSTFN